jgi:hypothetical protein
MVIGFEAYNNLYTHEYLNRPSVKSYKRDADLSSN